MKPIRCNYYVTLRCNSKCIFCAIWRNIENFKLREQTIDEIEKNLINLKKLGIKIIDFTGGEPLLYPHLSEALKIAKHYGFYTTVTTNCLLYPDIAQKLKGYVDVLQFSFESVDREKHNEIRGVNCYDKVLESVEVAKKIKQKVYLIHTVTDASLNDLPKLIKFAQEKKCILFINPCFGYFGNIAISKNIALKLKKYFKEPYVVLDLANLELILNGGNDINKPLCKAISSTITISPDNYLLLPCYHHCFKKLKIDNNLFKLYNSKEVKDLKLKEGKFSFCEGCTIYCYMQGSLYRKLFSQYFILSLISGYKYLRERLRKQF